MEMEDERTSENEEEDQEDCDESPIPPVEETEEEKDDEREGLEDGGEEEGEKEGEDDSLDVDAAQHEREVVQSDEQEMGNYRTVETGVRESQGEETVEGESDRTGVKNEAVEMDEETVLGASVKVIEETNLEEEPSRVTATADTEREPTIQEWDTEEYSSDDFTTQPKKRR